MTYTQKVLSIGDDESTASEKSVENRNVDILQESFRKHLCQLLTGSRIPIEVVEDWNRVDRFGVTSIKKDKQPRRYHFYLLHGNIYKPGDIFSEPVFDGKAIREVVRNRLIGENCISENVIETPLRTKFDRSLYHSSDQFIQQVVSDALNTKAPKLFRFLQFLHRNRHK